MVGRSAHLELARGLTHLGLQLGAVVEVTSGEGSAGSQPVQIAFETNLTSGTTRPRAEVNHVVGNSDGLRLVFDHQHGVSLIAEAQ